MENSLSREQIRECKNPDAGGETSRASASDASSVRRLTWRRLFECDRFLRHASTREVFPAYPMCSRSSRSEERPWTPSSGVAFERAREILTRDLSQTTTGPQKLKKGHCVTRAEFSHLTGQRVEFAAVRGAFARARGDGARLRRDRLSPSF